MKKRILTIFLAVVFFSIIFNSVSFADTEEIEDDNMLLSSEVTLVEEENTSIQSDLLSLVTDESKASATITNNGLSFSYTSAYQIFDQYVTSDGKHAKIIYGNDKNGQSNYAESKLYSYDIENDTMSLEYEFPTSTYASGVSQYYSSQYYASAYINEDSGVLYYAYNSYYNTFSNNEIINIIVYDLEKGSVLKTLTVKGHILCSLAECIGVDKNGNIYLSIDDYFKVDNNTNTTSYELMILSPTGSILCEKKVDYKIASFCGFCDDGRFYYLDYYLYSYQNYMGRLGFGTFNSTTNTVDYGEAYITYVKNIFWANYYRAAEILNDEYLVTYSGMLIKLSSVTTSSATVSLYASKDLDMGGNYSYIYNVGVNTVIDGDNVYSIYDNDTIYVYSLSTGEKLKYYNSENMIFNFVDYGDYLLVVETDGTNYFYKKVAKSDFTTIVTQTYNMNEFDCYKDRTKEDIISKFISATQNTLGDMSTTLYATTSSESSPYKEATLTDYTIENALNISNYYRWLAGLTEFESASDEVWSNAAKGAVLLAASGFSHTPSQPSDMSDEFYKAAYEGTSSSSIASNYSSNQYKIIYTIRQFMNDTGYTVPGHRNTFLTRNGTSIAYGFSSRYVCQTVEYTTDPNPQGTAVLDNNEAAYAWPSAGYFPAEDISTSAVWTVCLNTDRLSLSNLSLKVTIKDLDTGTTYERTSSADGLYSSTYWGMYISFDGPSVSGSSYAGKRYQVTLENLEDSEGMPAKLVYTVEFFSYNNTFEIDGIEYTCTEYGTTIPFTDVYTEHWSYEYIEYCYLNGLMTGYSDTTLFGTSDSVLRGQLVLILYRMEGSPKVTTSSSFSDVKDSSKYYYNAVLWAAKNGIVTGYTGTGLFKPMQSITREELATILYRYASYKKMNVTKTASLSSFADSSKVSSWAQTAVKWTVGTGIISGITSSNGKTVNISPQGTATRAQVATMIMRFCTKL